MSGSSSEFSDSGKQSSFSHTCSLLSRYLKEKGALGDLSLGMNFDGNGMTVAPASSANTDNVNTMNLFPASVPNYGDFAGIPRTRTPSTSRDVTSMDLFPQHSGFGPSGSKDEVPNKVFHHSVNKPMPETSQMTVFYRGRVFLFNDISAEKAKEITTFANQTSYHVSGTFVSGPTQRPGETPNAIGPNYLNNMPIERISSSIVSDVPIARKASLARFLEKRKDRVSARTPYQKSYSKASPPMENNKSWLGLAP